MGTVYADIELTNAVDKGDARRSVISGEEVRSLRLKMLADSGAYMMAIYETIQSQIQLPFVEKRKVRLANNSVMEYDVVGPIDVKFANRMATCSAFVLPVDSEPLLGIIPTGEMDVMIHPFRQELIVNPEHPDYAILRL